MRSGTRKTINLAAMRRPTNPWELKERQRDGRFKRETEAEVRAVGVNARIRMGVPLDDATDPLSGCTFGRLRLRHMITQTQYDAGLRWEGIVGRYARLRGIPSPHPRSPSAASVGGSSGTPVEALSDDEIRKRRDDYDEAFEALNDQYDGKEMLRAMKAIILMDQRGDIGALRLGLNTLVRIWG